MITNTKPRFTDLLSALFQTLSVAPRLEIMLAIGDSEACVCHLEAALGYRQAYISQHLMALREANLLETRRHGRFVYYKLVDRRILDVLAEAGRILGQPVEVLSSPVISCECPKCNSGDQRNKLEMVNLSIDQVETQT
jgi:ArsR family transcriptional regulator